MQDAVKPFDPQLKYVPHKTPSIEKIPSVKEDFNLTNSHMKSIKVGTTGIDIDTGSPYMDMGILLVIAAVAMAFIYGKYFFRK